METCTLLSIIEKKATLQCVNFIPEVTFYLRTNYTISVTFTLANRNFRSSPFNLYLIKYLLKTNVFFFYKICPDNSVVNLCKITGKIIVIILSHYVRQGKLYVCHTLLTSGINVTIRIVQNKERTNQFNCANCIDCLYCCYIEVIIQAGSIQSVYLQLNSVIGLQVVICRYF